jgi:hypothetical protein
MPKAPPFSVGTGKVLTCPSSVIRPISLVRDAVYHTAPSGPTARPNGPPLGVGMTTSPNRPSRVRQPIRFTSGAFMVNQIARSGPTPMKA